MPWCPDNGHNEMRCRTWTYCSTLPTDYYCLALYSGVLVGEIHSPNAKVPWTFSLKKKHANRKGILPKLAMLQIAATLNNNDLVFVDPPYSSVQYSRFYHVLETVALEVTVARLQEFRKISTSINERPQSAFQQQIRVASGTHHAS
ncbi:MAG: DNA adenine methylase [Anaerolineales bacterium]|nr:DNA adenine methylase [Anaerolineales bacterium]